MIAFLDTIHKMAIGAALVLILLKWARGFEVNDEIILMNLIWPIALLAKITLEKRSKVVAHG
ncbi:hypothetical protein [Sphingopyxis witflariensis]|uniref:Uncharacterized protein n=1 Tax=Sphingopyxis witflariensis TaxID=173675 RepID=A0A246K4M1_9SPHN|nr:hypothetical protein [Sphingopyxis witflariensis]OWR00923.1 hypothetical protein CDQ91_00305 [Sphingopyxis witflariensis]